MIFDPLLRQPDSLIMPFPPAFSGRRVFFGGAVATTSNAPSAPSANGPGNAIRAKKTGTDFLPAHFFFHFSSNSGPR